MPDGEDRSQKLQSYGWMLFVVGSLLFIADAVVNGSALAITASVLFFLGCFVFLVALRRG